MKPEFRGERELIGIEEADGCWGPDENVNEPAACWRGLGQRARAGHPRVWAVVSAWLVMSCRSPARKRERVDTPKSSACVEGRLAWAQKVLDRAANGTRNECPAGVMNVGKRRGNDRNRQLGQEPGEENQRKRGQGESSAAITACFKRREAPKRSPSAQLLVLQVWSPFFCTLHINSYVLSFFPPRTPFHLAPHHQSKPDRSVEHTIALSYSETSVKLKDPGFELWTERSPEISAVELIMRPAPCQIAHSTMRTS